MAEFDGGGKDGPSKKSKGSSLWDGLKQFGQGVLEGFADGVSPGGAAGARRDPVSSNERPAAAKQIHRSLKAWRDRENEAEDEADVGEKSAAGASRKAYRAPRVGQVPGLYNSASNVDKPLGSLKEPQGTLVYLDNPMNNGPDGKPTSVRTEVEWTGKDGKKATGSVKRSLKVNPDGTKTLIADAAFLDKIPREGNFVSSDGVVMLPGKGTPLHVYLSLRQMRMMGINEGDLGKTVTQVKISTIVNERAIDDLGLAVGWQKVAPNSDQLRGCHSGMYVENYVTQNGGVVLSARLESQGFAQLSAEKKKAKGLPPTQDAWELKPYFNIILECGVARPGMLPTEKKAP